MSMPRILPGSADLSSTDLASYAGSFTRQLRRWGRSRKTISSYMEAVDAFLTFCEGRAGGGGRADVDAFLDSLTERGNSPATVGNRFRSLQQFFNHLVDEGAIDESPMAKMRPPSVPRKLVPIITDEEVDAILAVCTGRYMTDRRDTAMIRLLLDTGLRVSELVGLAVEDVNFRRQEVFVYYAKGDKQRKVPFGDKAADCMEKYLRLRPKSFAAGMPSLDEDGEPRLDTHCLWVGKRGRMGVSGPPQMLERRSAEAGIPKINAHRFRHTAAHNAAKAGMSETDMMRFFGWDSAEMPKLYGASAGAERAIAAWQRLGLGERYR